MSEPFLTHHGCRDRRGTSDTHTLAPHCLVPRVSGNGRAMCEIVRKRWIHPTFISMW